MDTLQTRIKFYITFLINRYINKNFLPANFHDDLIEDLGFDSYDLKFIIAKIENEFQILILDEEFNQIKTISDIANLVSKKKNFISSL